MTSPHCWEIHPMQKNRMKKINRAYGEAIVSVRDKMSKRESTELPDYRIKTKSLDTIRNNIKDITARLQRQSKAHQVLINDNTTLADCFTECGNQLLQEEGHTTSSAAILGPTMTIIGDMHNQFEVSRSKLDIGIGNTLLNQWQEYLKNELKDALVSRCDGHLD
ncbi:hypothetical protein SAMD00019534_073010 [Acytostelium subglobosum LB1]|uniref:hypothetical protein n=1 Tax=Acytostelium subglobosum LB1 TaxID=1410327 RepID=UPI000644AF11|nr:hypothetical protein SAMD00019534_073010 [Acytostelium subglobosum LB1]GAM24126.1 hypothetical protein SAMD00019534_073010 [Acytostelium subglobosum LB1]|eukprot:XP_012753162.1 hypothetical protein SAMD00019534_073010 [Acytostelium subglobosum LB1]